MRKEQESILYYFSDRGSIMDQWQLHHFINELKTSNINFELFNPIRYDSLASACDSLLTLLRTNRAKYSLFFTGAFDNSLPPHVLSQIKELGIPTLLICFDNLHAPYLHKKIAPHFDLVWLTSFETEYIFKKWGANTIFQPYAANPYFFKPSSSPEINSVGFIGTPYGTRMKKLELLANHQIPVSIYSDSFFNQASPQEKKSRTIQEKAQHAINLINFPIGRKILYSELKNLFKHTVSKPRDFIKNDSIHLFPSVSANKMVDLYSSLAISLGITDVRNTYLLNKPVYKLHLRTFEIPMCGGLQIVNYTPEIASYFEDEKEIILYRSEEEFIDKTKFYIQDSQRPAREKMKIAARKRAESDHTWMNRFAKVYAQLGINNI